MAEQTSNQKPLSKALWWVYFAIATFVMSLCFQAFRVFTLEPNWETGLELVGVIALLGLVTVILMYDSYINERQQGKVHHSIWLFERIAQMQKGASHGS